MGMYSRIHIAFCSCSEAFASLLRVMYNLVDLQVHRLMTSAELLCVQ